MLADEGKILEIARMLKNAENLPPEERIGYSAKICKALGVSGRDIGRVQRLIAEGLIVYNPDGEPRFTIPYDKIRRAIKPGWRKSMTPEEISRETVVETFKEAVAEEAKNQTEAYLIAGRAGIQAVIAWLVKKGYTLEDIRAMPIHQIIIEALEKADKHDQLVEENRRLRQELELYRKETSPLVRLKTVTTEILPTTIANLVILQELGADVTELARHYDHLISLYLKGEQNAQN